MAINVVPNLALSGSGASPIFQVSSRHSQLEACPSLALYLLFAVGVLNALHKYGGRNECICDGGRRPFASGRPLAIFSDNGQPRAAPWSLANQSLVPVCWKQGNPVPAAWPGPLSGPSSLPPYTPTVDPLGTSF